MIPWTVLGNAPLPGGGQLRLARRGDEFSISIVGQGELMNSRVHSSEDALAELTLAGMEDASSPQVLIGGLGMGFTLAAALRSLPASASVVVAELVPEVVTWNGGPLGACAGHPVRDPRTEVRVADVADVIAERAKAWDAILLDVDNGPEGLTQTDNDRLYSRAGLKAAHRALRPSGVLAIWSAHPSPAFTARLKSSGFDVRTVDVRARQGRGARHVVWLARA